MRELLLVAGCIVCAAVGFLTGVLAERASESVEDASGGPSTNEHGVDLAQAPEPTDVHPEKFEDAQGFVEAGPFEGEPYASVDMLQDAQWGDLSTLCEASSHIFYGEALLLKGADNLPAEPGINGEAVPGVPMPKTLFQVEVKERVKGELPAQAIARPSATGEEVGNPVVVVGQHGGQVDESMPVEIFEDDEMIEPGAGYLFFTLYEENPYRFSIFAMSYGKEELEEGLALDERIGELHSIPECRE